MTIDRDSLITDALPLAQFLAGKYWPRGGDDAFQAACLGLCKAADRWEPARGRFSPHAARYIVNHIQRERDRWHAPRHVDETSLTSEDAETGFLDTIPGREPDPADIVVDRLTVTDLLARLDGRDRTIIELHYGLTDEGEFSLAAIGRRLGISRERTGQILHKTLKRLRLTPIP